jgi:hypothetical protein
MRRFIAASVGLLSLASLILVGASSVAARNDELAAVQAATARFHDLDQADAAGYGKFYVCTDEAGLGAMGQHYVNGGLVTDAVLDPSAPEALMFEPTSGGGERLVGVEWIVFKPVWEAAGNSTRPTLFGRPLNLVSVPNRYGTPDPFYELHGWVWKPNPSGVHSDWNPNVSCLGEGD